MSELNNSNNNINTLDNEDEELNQTNNIFSQKIMELEEIIKEKENIIYTLHSKIKQFAMNIDQLKIENEKLKNQIYIIEEEINKKKLYYDNSSFQIQPTQRFLVYRNVNNINNVNNRQSYRNKNYLKVNTIGNQYINSKSSENINELNLNSNLFNSNLSSEMINENFKSKIVPFHMKPFEKFDHSKLVSSNINNNTENNINIKNDNIFIEDDFINNNDKNFNIDINNKILDNINNIKKDMNKFNEKDLNNYTKDDLNNNSILNNSNIKNNKNNNNNNKAGIRLHSSMFFQNCKKIISKKEYKKLLEIVKLSNLKKISKEDTYLSITSLLEDNYPELSNEFKLLFS